MSDPAAPFVSVTIPQPAAAELLALIDRYPEQFSAAWRVAVRCVLMGAAVLGAKE